MLALNRTFWVNVVFGKLASEDYESDENSCAVDGVNDETAKHSDETADHSDDTSDAATNQQPESDNHSQLMTIFEKQNQLEEKKEDTKNSNNVKDSKGVFHLRKLSCAEKKKHLVLQTLKGAWILQIRAIRSNTSIRTIAVWNFL
jgi:hypothetical protein